MNTRTTSIAACLLVAGSAFAVTAWAADLSPSRIDVAIAPTELPPMEVMGTQEPSTRFESEFTQAELTLYRLSHSPEVRHFAPDELQRAKEALYLAESALAKVTFAGWRQYPLVRRYSEVALQYAALVETTARQRAGR